MRHVFHSHAAPLLALLAITSVMALTGCVADEPVALDAVKARPDVRPVDDEGNVLGAITSVAGVPMSHAAITLAELDLEGTVYHDGSYLFFGVPAGTYTVVVEVPAFIPASERVVVEPGQDAYVDFVLTRAGVESPWREVNELAGFIECSAEAGYDVHSDVEPTLTDVDILVRERTNIDPNLRSGYGVTSGYAGHILCGALDVALPNTTNDRHRHEFFLGPEVRTLVFETSWEPNSEMAENLTVLLEVEGFANAYPGTFARKQGEPPIQTRFDAEAWGWMDAKFREACVNGRNQYCGHDLADEGFPMQARVFPAWDCLDERAGACAVVEQPFSHFVSAFYGAEGPPGWMLAAGGP